MVGIHSGQGHSTFRDPEPRHPAACLVRPAVLRKTLSRLQDRAVRAEKVAAETENHLRLVEVRHDFARAAVDLGPGASARTAVQSVMDEVPCLTARDGKERIHQRPLGWSQRGTGQEHHRGGRLQPAQDLLIRLAPGHRLAVELRTAQPVRIVERQDRGLHRGRGCPTIDRVPGIPFHRHGAAVNGPHHHAVGDIPLQPGR